MDEGAWRTTVHGVTESNTMSNFFILYVHTYISKIQQQQMKNNRCSQEYGKTKTPISCRWECKTVQFLWKTVLSLKNLNIELPYDSTIPLLGISKRIENIRPKKHCYTKVHSSIIHNREKVEKNAHSLMNENAEEYYLA